MIEQAIAQNYTKRELGVYGNCRRRAWIVNGDGNGSSAGVQSWGGGKCNGAFGRPLAEVVPEMPRCAPLRLLEDEQVGCHLLRPCQCALIERSIG